MEMKSKSDENTEEFQFREDYKPDLEDRLFFSICKASPFLLKFAKRILLVLLYIIISLIVVVYLLEKDLFYPVMGPILGVFFFVGLLAMADPTNLFFHGKMNIIFGIIVALVIGCVTGKFLDPIWGTIAGALSLIAFYYIRRDFE